MQPANITASVALSPKEVRIVVYFNDLLTRISKLFAQSGLNKSGGSNFGQHITVVVEPLTYCAGVVCPSGQTPGLYISW